MRTLLIFLISLCASMCHGLRADEDLILVQQGNVPILITAPHGGKLAIAGVPPRKGIGLKIGADGFRVSRDTGTEELALLVAKELEQRLSGRPWLVISRVHRRYVDFNRPAQIAYEHEQAKVVYDSWHQNLRFAVNEIRREFHSGLLIDIHGQATSASTVYRGTGNGLTVRDLISRSGPEAHAGPGSLLGRLRQSGWKVHPDPLDGKEQEGFTGGHIVRSFGSHQPDGIDAVQLELGADFRLPAGQQRTAEQLATAIAEFAKQYLIPKR